MKKDCVPAGQEKGKGQRMARGKGKGPMGVSSEGDYVMDKYQVIDLIDRIINEELEEGEPNDLKNEPSQNPEEELDRVEDDLGGDESDALEDYMEGEDDEDDDYDEDEMMEMVNMMVDSTILDQDNAYQTYFRNVMKKHNIDGIRGLSPEKRSAFFKDVSSGWKNHKNGVKEQLSSHRRVDFSRGDFRGGRYQAQAQAQAKKRNQMMMPRRTPTPGPGTVKPVNMTRGYEEQQVFEDYKKYFRYLTDQCGIENISELQEQDLVEFYALVHEAFEVGVLYESYKDTFKNVMDKFDVSSIKDLKGDEKKAFFNQLDSAWKGKEEKEVSDVRDKVTDLLK